MNKLTLLLFLSAINCCYSNATRYSILVENGFDDKTDPIIFKQRSVNFGKVLDVSCIEGQPIGKYFKITMETKTYSKKEYGEKDRKFDWFSIGNKTCNFKFEIKPLGNCPISRPHIENLRFVLLPYNKGYWIFK